MFAFKISIFDTVSLVLYLFTILNNTKLRHFRVKELHHKKEAHRKEPKRCRART